MDRAQKAEQVAYLRGVFEESGSVVVFRNGGLSVANMMDFRNRTREAGGAIKVIKNRLAKIALEGAPGEGAQGLFTGPSAILFSKDPVAPAKLAVDFANDNEKFELIGGVLGATVLDEAGVKALAKMPSLDEMRAKLAGVLLQPGSRLATALSQPGTMLATVLSAPGRDLASVLRQRSEQSAA